jgi:hypothetical protein
MASIGRSARKRIAAGAAAVAVGLATSLVGARPAGAATVTQDHDVNVIIPTATATCTIRATQVFPVPGSPQVARASTVVLFKGGDPLLCLGLTAYVSASYDDPAGTPVTTGESSAFATISQDYSPVGSHLHTFHRVTSTTCNCSSETWELTQPK